MFYYQGLEEVIFNIHSSLNELPDELIVVSGYLGPAPIERLSELPFKVSVYGGMYTKGIDSRLFKALNKAKEKNPKLFLFYSKIEIHSKIYIWKKNDKILTALIGSANFSANGLQTDLRETLAVANRGTYPALNAYIDVVKTNSTNEPVVKEKNNHLDVELNDTYTKDKDKIFEKSSCVIPLYKELKTGLKVIPKASGLNWGLSKGHVTLGDAYIKIPKVILGGEQDLIKPFDPMYENVLTKKKRASDPVEVIWDDGTIMTASLEGKQKGADGREYPKQLASYGSKKVLGIYLRNRLGVDINHEIKMEDLEKYGRSSVKLSLIDNGVYYCDFSNT